MSTALNKRLAVAALLAAVVGPLRAGAQGSISGRISYHANDVPLAGVTVNLSGPSPDSTLTDANGNYQFTGIAPGTWTVTPFKNGDERGSITAFDASTELNCVVGNISPTAPQILSCDATASSSLTAFDAVNILNYRVGNIAALQVVEGCGSNWAFLPTPQPTAGQTPIAPQPNRTPTLCRPGAITVDNLGGDAAQQNFAALLFGDCNGNWPNQSPTPTPTPTPFGGVPWPALAGGTPYTGLSAPVYVTWGDNADGNSRVFVVLQSGKVRLIKNGVLQTTPFLDIGASGANRISFSGEQGLLSIALPPGYATKRYFYLNYTNTAGNTVIARYRLDAVNNDLANANSEQILLTVTQPYSNHNGGQLQFGPDGYLYIGMGDGGSANDPQNYAQNSTSLLGKILRIDVESAAPTPTPYLIPASNPTPNPTFTRTPGYRREIWASGVRNPWRFSFDRLAGDLYIADVGQDAWEEVDVQSAGDSGGENYGWRLWEGNHATFNCVGCTAAGFTFPVFEYPHTNGNCSITGGYVYRGSSYPCLHGTYLYSDYCTGNIWGARHAGGTWQTQLLLATGVHVTCFGEDGPGNLYYCDASNGRIVPLQDACVAATLTPTPTASPTATPTAT